MFVLFASAGRTSCVTQCIWRLYLGEYNTTGQVDDNNLGGIACYSATQVIHNISINSIKNMTHDYTKVDVY